MPSTVSRSLTEMAVPRVSFAVGALTASDRRRGVAPPPDTSFASIEGVAAPKIFSCTAIKSVERERGVDFLDLI